MSKYVIETPLIYLQCEHAFNQLSDEEKLYVHHLNEANWAGFPISVKQTSVEAYGIFIGFIHLYKTINHNELREKCKGIVTEEEFTLYENYVNSFLTNGGNYLSYGDKKFIPGCSKESFIKITSVTGLHEFDQVIDLMYDTSSNLIQYGLPPNSCTAYYSKNITKEEIDHVNEVLLKHGYLLENTRIDKDEKTGKLIVGIASVVEKTEELEDLTIHYGVYKDELERIVNSLKKVMELPMVKSNENKLNMFKEYITAFTSDYVHHKDSQRYWVKDSHPSVELNIGFIETYEDPVGVRGEWEMFVAVVDKEKTKELSDLVNSANEILPSLPWGKEFEKVKFEKPDFTSIDIIGYGTSGLPIGINLPNYDDVRMEGFKNVSLSNVMTSRSNDEKTTFIKDSQQELFNNNSSRSLEIQVALHELLGHGSGRYLRCDNGKLNFTEGLLNPLTNKPVTYYTDAEDYNSKFKELGNVMEECRAETVSIVLTYNPVVSKIMKITKEQKYVNWIIMALGGILGLQHYNVEKKAWGQAHCKARFAILKTMMKSGILRMDKDYNIELDEEKIETDGMKAINELLLKLQVCRATGDVEYAKQFFGELTTPDEEDLKLRQVVIDRKKPRKGFIQCNTKLVNGKVELINYEATTDSLVKSFEDRYDYL